MYSKMTKSLCIMALGALLLATPLQAVAWEGCMQPTAEVTAATLSISGNTVRVNGAEGEVLRVYSLTGLEVARYTIESNDVQLNLGNLNHGYYIIKVGKVVRKISIR